MGLDMYLEAERYVSGYEFTSAAGRTAYAAVVAASGLDVAAAPDTPSATVRVTVGYWRKANAIHGWFVRTLADGVDECQRIDVGRADLERLRDSVRRVLAQTAPDLRAEQAEAEGLSPQAGFFFGSTEIDQGYDQDLRTTLNIIDRVLPVLPPDANLYYQASW